MDKWKRKLNEEKGAVEVVEAALVFPIVIFVVILLIFVGNLLYQQAKMDAIAVRGAEYLAAVYTNPLLAEDALPTDTNDVDVKPYRYLSSGTEAEGLAKEYINKLVQNTDTGYFSGMETQDFSIATCNIKNYVVYQTAEVQLEYSIQLLPMKLLGGVTLFRCSNATVTAATDSAEFIRNVDMIMDYSESFGLTDKIKEIVGKFKGK